jgi:hypothetical protein
VRAFNKRHGRRGPLLDRRFHTTLVKDDAHAISCLRYIARNPIEAGVCKRERDWRCSSHRALAGIASRPAFLTRFILGEGPEAAARYRELFES